MNRQLITADQVKHIAKLANIPVTEQEEMALAQAFNETLDVIEELKSVDVTGVEPTHQVTGLKNITRDDEVIPTRMLTQIQALANANRTYQGYFVVPRVIDEKDE